MENIDLFDVFSYVNVYFTVFPMLVFSIIILAWGFIIKTLINSVRRTQSHKFFKSNVVDNTKKTNGNSNKYKRTYNDVSKEKLAKFNTDNISSLKEYFYNQFVEFEKAYNNLDYNIIKILSTKELYNNYYTGISLDLKVGQKRIIQDIERKQVIIFELDSTIAKQIASVMIEVSYINYITDKKGHVISGSRDEKITEKFEVEFRKDFDRKEIVKCQTCGADAIAGNKCDYCRTIVKNVEFKISSIKKIIDN